MFILLSETVNIMCVLKLKMALFVQVNAFVQVNYSVGKICFTKLTSDVITNNTNLIL